MVEMQGIESEKFYPATGMNICRSSFHYSKSLYRSLLAVGVTYPPDKCQPFLELRGLV
jgi:hypothetical protein